MKLVSDHIKWRYDPKYIRSFGWAEFPACSREAHSLKRDRATLVAEGRGGLQTPGSSSESLQEW